MRKTSTGINRTDKNKVPHLPLDSLLYIPMGVQSRAKLRILPSSAFNVQKWARKLMFFSFKRVYLSGIHSFLCSYLTANCYYQNTNNNTFLLYKFQHSSSVWKKFNSFPFPWNMCFLTHASVLTSKSWNGLCAYHTLFWNCPNKDTTPKNLSYSKDKQKNKHHCRKFKCEHNLNSS